MRESNDEMCQEGGYRNFKKLTGTVENFSQRAARRNVTTDGVHWTVRLGKPLLAFAIMCRGPA